MYAVSFGHSGKVLPVASERDGDAIVGVRAMNM